MGQITSTYVVSFKLRNYYFHDQKIFIARVFLYVQVACMYVACMYKHGTL